MSEPLADDKKQYVDRIANIWRDARDLGRGTTGNELTIENAVMATGQWAETLFGRKVIESHAERGLRVFEEAVEFAMECGVSLDDLRRSLAVIFARTETNRIQEINHESVAEEASDVLITLMVAAFGLNIPLADSVCNKMLNNSTVERVDRIRAKQAAKGGNGSTAVIYDGAMTEHDMEDLLDKQLPIARSQRRKRIIADIVQERKLLGIELDKYYEFRNQLSRQVHPNLLREAKIVKQLNKRHFNATQRAKKINNLLKEFHTNPSKKEPKANG